MFILPEHEFFNTKYIIINNNVIINNEKITDEYNFLYWDKINNIDISLFKKNKEKVIEILKSIFIIKNNILLDKNDLLIHIRSGDIFHGNNPHPNYIPPPLFYYVDIIKKNNFNRIYLIAQDRKNPCIEKLLQLFPKIIFKIQSLEEDIKIILGATNIVTSIGTFIPEILTFSDIYKNIYFPSYSKTDEYSVSTMSKDIYSPSYSLKNKIDGVNKFFIDLSDYYILMYPWKNLTKQNNLIITYNL